MHGSQLDPPIILLNLTGHASDVIAVTVFYLEPRTVHLPPVFHHAMLRLDHQYTSASGTIRFICCPP
ncbi:hypothetical protein ACKLNR_000416 [Fusarium oxysporum f. sp. zingiberi]